MKYITFISIAALSLSACHSNPAADRLAKMASIEFFPSAQGVALANAAARGQSEKIKQLLDEGVDVNLRGKDGMTPLLWAFIKQNKTGYKSLLEHGANPNLQITQGGSVTSFAAIHESTELLALALQHGGNPNAVNPHTGKTPIYDSIDHMRWDSVRLLMRNGANLNFRDPTGSTPVMRSANLNRYDIVYEMLKTGADPSVKDNWGNTILYFINDHSVDPKHELYQWRSKVIELLKERGMPGI